MGIVVQISSLYLVLTKRFFLKDWLFMNGKTAKLINRYAEAKGYKAKDLKKKWLSLNKKERFLERQKILKELKDLYSK